MEAKKHKEKYGLEVHSFDQFLSIIQELDTEVGFSSHERLVLFRGQHDTHWDLIPCIFRPEYGDKSVAEVERKIFEDFKRRAVPFLPHNFNVNSEWDWLALAQQFKLPTRLLDWTENPLVALYFTFAQRKWDQHDRAFWIFAPMPDDFADTTSPESTPFNQKEIKVFMPNQITQRITVQAGWFTVHHYCNSTSMMLNNNPAYDKKIRLLKIPNHLRMEILRMLDRLGINAYSSFPDLDGLSSYLDWKYFKK